MAKFLFIFVLNLTLKENYVDQVLQTFGPHITHNVLSSTLNAKFLLILKVFNN